MAPLAELLLWSAAAGACIPAGGLLARVERVFPRWLDGELRHFVIAFGGGVLLGAVALVLLPAGIEHVQAPALVLGCFLAGGVVFFVLERWLGHRRSESPQFLAMMLDYVPESLAMGGAFALGAPAAPLLAVLIGLQNLPEGFNAYRELLRLPALAAPKDERAPRRRTPPEGSPATSRRVLVLMVLMVPIGPLLAGLGWAFLEAHTQLLGAIMLFASGGILYLIFQDIAPQARLNRHWFPPLGAVAGFALGLLGKLLVDLR